MDQQQTPNLYLASQSPRRRELLDQIGVRYRCVSLDVPEQRLPAEAAQDYVVRLAKAKAAAGWLQVKNKSVPVLGSDTIVVCAGEVLEKPGDEQQAVNMLLRMSGSEHLVLTAVALCMGDRCQTRLSTTTVRFRAICEAEARRYWHSGEPSDKAGGYGIQGLGAIFVESIKGSYSGVMGLPLYETSQLLGEFDVPVWQVSAISQEEESSRE